MRFFPVKIEYNFLVSDNINNNNIFNTLHYITLNLPLKKYYTKMLVSGKEFFNSIKLLNKNFWFPVDVTILKYQVKMLINQDLQFDGWRK